MNAEVIDITTNKKTNVSFFDDDSIDTIRQRIGISMDIHPDRICVWIGIKYDKDYYLKDPRRWEALFARISYNGQPIQASVFSEYQIAYRTPSTSVPFQAFDKTTWMTYPESLRPIYEPDRDFLEYRIFGVDEKRSYILPQSILSSPLLFKISSADNPIPNNLKLLNSLYAPDRIVRFLVTPYDPAANALIYFPFFRTTTPPKLPLESIRLVEKSTSTFGKLMSLDVPEPTQVTILKTRFYIPWVNTEFGNAVRTRFEQIFYGFTVSKESPSITLFTCKDEVNRHKFFTTNPKDKVPFQDMDIWKKWWSVKPARNIPSLILFRGTSREYFDRVTITSMDMVISTFRPVGNKETIDQLYRQAMDWVSTFDSVLPFIHTSDLDKSRCELQDVSLELRYKEKLDTFDLLRFNCISNIFDLPNKSKSEFTLLRTDRIQYGVSAIDVKILTMLKESKGRDIHALLAEELSIPEQLASRLVNQLQLRLNDDPQLEERVFRNYPILKFGPEHVIISSISKIDRAIQYSNILRFILSDPSSKDLNDVCPKRSERVAAETTVVPMEVDAAAAEELADMFDDILENVEPEVDEEPEEKVTVNTSTRKSGEYSKFLNLLQKFDPDTFNSNGSMYAKKCEKNHQPNVLSDAQVTALKGTPYDTSKIPENKRIDTENPDGMFVCPEFWCMRDQIPLEESQLERSGKILKCPVCHGKLQTSESDDPREYPLIKRKSGFNYPGVIKDYVSPKNKRHMPCCYKKPQKKELNMKLEDKYYVLSEDKDIDEDRIAFLPKIIRESLKINEAYEIFLDGDVRRLMSPNKGFFRAGLGHSSETLHKFLRTGTKVPPPRESISNVLKCSFFHTWTRHGTSHIDTIERGLKDLVEDPESVSKLVSGVEEAFHDKTLTPLQELEYSSICLNCDVFRIELMSGVLKCMFYAPMVRPRSRGIIVLDSSNHIDILAYTERKSRGFEFRVNIFERPFQKETYVELEKLRNSACKTTIPSYNDALAIIPALLDKTKTKEFQIILDPFGRGQAFFIPSELILPFQSTPLPNTLQSKVRGYKDISEEMLPPYGLMRTMLDDASKLNAGYAFREDLMNTSHQIVEILVDSGLRIPVVPSETSVNEPTEVIQTTQEIGESTLSFGNESAELRAKKKEISYAAEVYEFLLFQLTKDLENDYIDLSVELHELRLNPERVRTELRKWFDSVTHFVNIREPKQFVSKIRKPCTDACDGDLCGWDGKVCKVKISETLNKEKLFDRLLRTLLDNLKIRAMVLEGRTTPFFSTILYLELPHEIVRTDNEI